MRAIYIAIFTLTFFISSCSTVKKSVKKKIDLKGPLFNDGIYHHSVKININNQKKQFTLKGILKIDKNNLQLVALSPFNSTLLEITKINGESLTVKIYNERLKKHKEFIKRLFTLFTLVVSKKYQDLDDQNSINLTGEKFSIVALFTQHKAFFEKIVVKSKNFNFIVMMERYEKI